MADFSFVIAANGIETSALYNDTGANLALCATGWHSSGNVPTDTAGNTYVNIQNADFGDAATSMFIANAPIATGAAEQITSGSTGNGAVCFMAFLSAVGQAISQSANGGTNSAVTSLQPGAGLTPNGSHQLAIASLSTTGTPLGIAIDSGFTIATSRPAVSGVNYGCTFAYLLNPTYNVLLNPTWSWTNAAPGSAALTLIGPVGIGEILTRDGITIYPTSVMKTMNALAQASIRTIDTLHPN